MGRRPNILVRFTPVFSLGVNCRQGALDLTKKNGRRRPVWHSRSTEKCLDE